MKILFAWFNSLDLLAHVICLFFHFLQTLGVDCDFQLLILIVNFSKLNIVSTMSKVTDKDLPFNGNPNPLLDFANVGPPYVAILSLPGFTIGLPLWLFSTSLIQNTQNIPLQLST